MELGTAIEQCKESIDVFVLVGGSALRERTRLRDAIERTVRVRFLFPRTDSKWFVSYVSSAGLSVDDYSQRVSSNSARATMLGADVEVRHHFLPVHSWFILIDRRIVLTKPIAFFSDAPIHFVNDAPLVEKFRDNFEIAWLSALAAQRDAVRCFMSYSRADDAVATRIRTLLIKYGIECWRDVDDIPKGANWDAEIQRAIDQSTHVLLIATGNSVKSDNVADEIGYARNNRKTIIPIILEEVQLPLRIHRAQGIEFIKDFDVGMQLLLGVLKY